MGTIADPVLRNWYKDLETQQTFRVVAVDEATDAIEVQYFGGEIAEFDSDIWYTSEFERIEPPEDGAAPFDDLADDDLGYTDPDGHSPQKRDINLSDLLEDY